VSETRVAASPSWSLEEIARFAGGELLAGPELARPGPAVTYERISLDTRTLETGDFFVALRGATHDGHDFVGDAAARGAVAALLDRPVAPPGLPQIRVEDSLAGWQLWASRHRERWTGGPLVGITGSSGKTTAKNILAHLLAARGPVRATEGNRNNHVGLPWSLLGLGKDHRFAVFEMGMNHPGEIRRLARLASPTAAMITGIGRAHIGHLGSREAVLRAKLEILEGLTPGAPVVLPDDPWIRERLPEGARRHPIRTFGLEASADWHPDGPVVYRLDRTRFSTARTGSVVLSLPGEGSVLSALAALAMVDALGLDPRPLGDRLAGVTGEPLRMEHREIDGVHWLLDCYNASPESTRLAIEFLRTVSHPGRKILVLGELGELGAESEAIHRELGGLVSGVDVALFIADGARIAFEACNRQEGADQAFWMASREEAAGWLASGLRAGDLVLLKAARRLALERILERSAPPASPAEGRRG
jgi:UDP-N-acetylmuramoyl-tripeptide--D-alanyl-D-alanine ligase